MTIPAGRRLRSMISGQRPIRWLLVVSLLVLVVIPVVGLNAYYIHIAALVLIYSSLALGLNVVVGLAGLLDLGYIGFYAVGAYTYALLTTQMDAPRFAAVAAAGLSALAIGVLLGWPTIRTHGDYLALVTLGFGEMIRLLARNWTNLTNGPRGIMDIPPPGIEKLQFDTPAEYYYIALLLASFALVVFLRIRQSSVGLNSRQSATTKNRLQRLAWTLCAGSFMPLE